MKLEDIIHNFVEDTLISLKITNSKGFHETLVAFRYPSEKEDVRD